MKIFVTGATGWGGFAIVRDCLEHGHAVAGLTRSESKAIALSERGATVVSGTLDDLDVLRDAAASADAVIHTAFNHDFPNFAASCEQDARAIQALGEALAGKDRPLLVTDGIPATNIGEVTSETDPASDATPRRSEAAAARVTEMGVRTSAVDWT